MPQAIQALDDIRILDLTHFYNGPYATLTLAFLGAEVIKVEPPGRGEGGRTLYKAPGAALGLPFAMMNSNKRSITLNIKSERGKDIFRRLVSRFDVLVENFSLGTMKALGLGYETLMALNPRLIYATGTGYGLTGPYKSFPAFDPVVQAMGGVLGTSGEASGPPMKAGPAIVDILGGIHLAAGILAAIRERDKTGKGLLLEVSLHDTVIPTLTTHVGAYFGLGRHESLRNGNRAPGAAVAPYNVYRASDGHVLILGSDEPRWIRLCALMGRPELAHDPRFSSVPARVKNQDALDAAIGEWTATLAKEELMRMLNANDIFCGVVKNLPEVMSDPHLHERGMLRVIEHPAHGPVTVFTTPLRLHGEPAEIRSPSPALGADNEDFYAAELGLTRDEITGLHKDGVI
ncbi:MAG TPA: CoA transferase [Candidatus Binataceae bacterium]|nr:CoA transferase [Candidatus Binataceae bacterium]